MLVEKGPRYGRFSCGGRVRLDDVKPRPCGEWLRAKPSRGLLSHNLGDCCAVDLDLDDVFQKSLLAGSKDVGSDFDDIKKSSLSGRPAVTLT